LFSYVDLEDRVRRDHPLRAIRTIVNEALSAQEREFAGLYSPSGVFVDGNHQGRTTHAPIMVVHRALVLSLLLA
jgi:hypothetical protein